MSDIFTFAQQEYNIDTDKLSSLESGLFSIFNALAPIDSAVCDAFYQQLFCGAYIFIPDEGQTYQTLVETNGDNLKNRDSSSSHASIDSQYSFYGNSTGECLFGTHTIDGKKGTWLQLEKYSTDLIHLPGHMGTYIVYLVTGENTGPYGNSTYTESNPFILTEPSHKTLTMADVISNDVIPTQEFVPVIMLEPHMPYTELNSHPIPEVIL